jgi:hypothetical protein
MRADVVVQLKASQLTPLPNLAMEKADHGPWSQEGDFGGDGDLGAGAE